EFALGQGADLGGGYLAALEDDHRRNSANPIFHWGLRVLVDIDLGDGHPAGHVGCELFEEWADHAARSAPFRPEIDDHRPAGAEHFGVEAAVGDGDRLHLNVPSVYSRWRLGEPKMLRQGGYPARISGLIGISRGPSV